ncbi:MAG: type II toxin-antitoxin system MqsA family antitoxin, partial [Anaerolineae bacterium]|nr:type II toxin-antitoxin system MqsA family antitoxin [Anaerolineae bacterium]
EPGSDKCYFCGGRLTNGVSTLPFVVDGRVVIIKQVPAQICSQCGEAILVSEVAVEVDRLLKQARQAGFEVSILTYSEHDMARQALV